MTPAPWLLLLSLTLGADPVATKPRNVLDYYLLLPESVFWCEVAPPVVDQAFREAQILHKNVKNGYLTARSEAWTLQVALFRDRARGVDLIAVNRPCGMGCMCDSFQVLRYDAGKWATWDAFPTPDAIRTAAGLGADDGYELVLPEVGTDIQVVDPASRKVRATIRWAGGVFTLGG